MYEVYAHRTHIEECQIDSLVLLNRIHQFLGGGRRKLWYLLGRLSIRKFWTQYHRLNSKINAYFILLSRCLIRTIRVFSYYPIIK